MTPPLPSARRHDTPPAASVPEEWAWHHRTLLHLQDRLSLAHAEHAAAALQAGDRSGADLADCAEELVERDVLWAELAVQDNMRLEVAGALQRIRDGTYGRCEATGLPIAKERLRAAPWTRYSLSAAAKLTPHRASAQAIDAQSPANPA